MNYILSYTDLHSLHTGTCSLISGYFSSGERWGTLLLTYSIN